VGTDPETFLPGFGTQLLGACAGEKRQVAVLFPAGFQPQELVGLQATYEVEVVEVKQKVLPELNDEFAKSWGAENLEKLREGVRRDLERELQYTQKKNIQAQIIQTLLSRAQFELPESLVAQETRDIVYDIVAENTRRGVSKELLEQHKDEIFRTAMVNARDRVKLNFILFKIAEKEGIKATPEEIMRRIYTMATLYQIPADKLIKELQKRGGIEEIRDKLIIEKTLEFLEANAAIEDVP
jgi:trigger factor